MPGLTKIAFVSTEWNQYLEKSKPSKRFSLNINIYYYQKRHTNKQNKMLSSNATKSLVWQKTNHERWHKNITNKI